MDPKNNFGFVEPKPEDFQFTDEQLEDDFAELNEEAEVEELQSSSPADKFAFFSKRLEELRTCAQQLRAQGAPEAAIDFVKQRGMVAASVCQKLKSGANVRITQVPQVPTLSTCLKAAKKSARKIASSNIKADSPDVHLSEEEKQIKAVLAQTQAMLAQGASLLKDADPENANDEDLIDLNDDEADDDGNEFDIDHELNQSPRFPRRNQQAIATEYPQRSEASARVSVAVTDADHPAQSDEWLTTNATESTNRMTVPSRNQAGRSGSTSPKSPRSPRVSRLSWLLCSRHWTTATNDNGCVQFDPFETSMASV
eukprot:m.64828 g.64828  ORF g.64828 m.64828 type:complete len:312 (-) comp13511_c0_seq2:1670-2605(-)